MKLMTDWKRKYLILEEKVEKAENILNKLIEENNKIKSELKSVQIENKRLTAENIKLKEKLGLNSKTSSIPSSKELYKLKKNNQQKSSRKQGGQPGHKGYFRQAMTSDEVIEIEIESNVCECGGEIGLLNHPSVHQKIDIPEIKPFVQEYHLQKGRCKSCSKRKTATLPTGVTKDVFGPRIKSIIGSLVGFYKTSKRDTVKILNDLFNTKISVGCLSNNESRISEKCLESYENIELELSYSKRLHIDETSHFNKGKMGWCWLFANENASLIKLEDSRGKKVLENSVFGASDHIITTDRYAAYNYFDSDNRQICWAHLARDFERLSNSSYVNIKNLGLELSCQTRELFALKKALDREEIETLRFLRRAKIIRQRMCYYLKKMSCGSKGLQATRLAGNILKSENMMWRFLEDPVNIPLTNNHAEQQIRHYVTYRKNSYFTQSTRGNSYLERIISLYLTWKKRGQNPANNLYNLIAS